MTVQELYDELKRLIEEGCADWVVYVETDEGFVHARDVISFPSDRTVLIGI